MTDGAAIATIKITDDYPSPRALTGRGLFLFIVDKFVTISYFVAMGTTNACGPTRPKHHEETPPMELIKITGATFAVAAFIFFAPLLGVVIGAFSGWVVGLFFEQTVMGFLARLGFDAQGFAMWQIGASLGFIGSFFRAVKTGSN